MPFLSTTDKRNVSQNLTQASFVEEASFSETFAAGVGQVFDEELSVSSMLNMQGFNQRKQQVKEQGDSGAFNINEYTSGVGDVDYEKISKDFPDFKIKDNKTLFEERATLLKNRREYAQDVFERGNGMAQFLGMATAYMLDPINVATMPIATAGTAVKGLGALGKAITVGRNEAGLAVAAELMIQPLVYQHKHDINSPFEFKDALLNIVTAAAGAAAIGGTVGGISGYLKNVREKTIDLPLDSDSSMALQSLARVEDDLNIINGGKDFESQTTTKTTKTDDVVTVKSENGKLTGTVSGDTFKVEVADILDPSKRGKGEGVSIYKAAIADAEAKGLSKFESDNVVSTSASRVWESLERQGFLVSKNPDARLVKHDKGDFLTVDADEVPVYSIDLKKHAEQGGNERLLRRDQNTLINMNNKMGESNQPSKVKENYIQPERKAATTGSVSQRERAVVERNGLTKEYDADIEAFNALENKRIVQDGEVVDANAFMKSIDDEMKGIEEVLTCAI